MSEPNAEEAAPEAPPIVARCLHCGAQTEHPPAEAGRKFDCPECGSPRRVPDVEKAQARALTSSYDARAREVARIEKRFVLGVSVFGGSFMLLGASAALTARPDLPGLFGEVYAVRAYLGGFGAVFFACGAGFHLTRQLAFAYLASVLLAIVIFSPAIAIPLLAARDPSAGVDPALLLKLLVLPLVALGPLQSVYALANHRKRMDAREEAPDLP